MICVAEDDLGFDVVAQFMLMYGLDTPNRTDWHEDRGLNQAVCGSDESCPGLGAGAGIFKLEIKCSHLLLIV